MVSGNLTEKIPTELHTSDKRPSESSFQLAAVYGAAQAPAKV